MQMQQTEDRDMWWLFGWPLFFGPVLGAISVFAGLTYYVQLNPTTPHTIRLGIILVWSAAVWFIPPFVYLQHSSKRASDKEEA